MEGKIAYRNDCLEGTIQLVDIGKNLLKVLVFPLAFLEHFSCCLFLFDYIVALGNKKPTGGPTIAISPMSSSRCCSKYVFSLVPDWDCEWEKVR